MNDFDFIYEHEAAFLKEFVWPKGSDIYGLEFHSEHVEFSYVGYDGQHYGVYLALGEYEHWKKGYEKCTG